MDRKFNPSTSDVKVQSSDGRVFDLHKSLLEAHTGAFPGPEVGDKNEVIKLTEAGDVLELLFAFVYPKPHPDLVDVDFDLVAALAEAVGKYEVYSAVNTCNTRLRTFLPDGKIEIFGYALKHGYPKLADEAYPYLVGTPLFPVLERLPAHFILPWVKYHEQWSSVISDARKMIKNLTIASKVTICHPGSVVCNTCRSSLYTWVATIEEQPSTSALKHELLNACIIGSPSFQCCKNAPGAYEKKAAPPKFSLARETKIATDYIPPAPTDPRCDHILTISQACLKKVESIPGFSVFVEQYYKA